MRWSGSRDFGNDILNDSICPIASRVLNLLGVFNNEAVFAVK